MICNQWISSGARLLLLAIIVGSNLFWSTGIFAESKMTDPTVKSSTWVVVLDDPRPERLKGWSRGSGYSGAGRYDDDLALNRLTNSILENMPVELVAQWPIKSINVHCLVVNIPEAYRISIIQKLESDTRVKWVQTYQTFEGKSLDFKLVQADNSHYQTDPYLRLQTTFKQLNIEEISQFLTGQGVTIAMIDSGVESDHPELNHALIEQLDFVSLSEKNIPSEHHGTGIAGVMIAKKGNGKGIMGLAPLAKLYAYRSCWETNKGKTLCDSLTIARGLDRVATVKPDILNLSLTGPRDRLLDSLIEVIVKNGTHVVAAYDIDRDEMDRFPVLRAGVSIAQDSFSKKEHSAKVIFAPGKEVLTTQPGKTYAFMSGSSIASAHLASLFALAIQASPDINLSEFGELFETHTQKTSSGKQTDICAVFLDLKIDIKCQQKTIAQN